MPLKLVCEFFEEMMLLPAIVVGLAELATNAAYTSFEDHCRARSHVDMDNIYVAIGILNKEFAKVRAERERLRHETPDDVIANIDALLARPEVVLGEKLWLEADTRKAYKAVKGNRRIHWDENMFRRFIAQTFNNLRSTALIENYDGVPDLAVNAKNVIFMKHVNFEAISIAMRCDKDTLITKYKALIGGYMSEVYIAMLDLDRRDIIMHLRRVKAREVAIRPDYRFQAQAQDQAQDQDPRSPPPSYAKRPRESDTGDAQAPPSKRPMPAAASSSDALLSKRPMPAASSSDVVAPGTGPFPETSEDELDFDDEATELYDETPMLDEADSQRRGSPMDTSA